ncbi:hypothetical protein DFJ63DRAFT_313625 [Scheffersomyces coipomensis]|uniref:uncharacterized protein n=1 Tax=Scheffersomyces coipomensis TaxID=1788519 RepID=UPI00315D9CBF
MLQARQLSQLLSQSLQPITVPSTINGGGHLHTGPEGISPFAISLLSNEGIPLTTVINHKHHYQTRQTSTSNEDDIESGKGSQSGNVDGDEGYNSDNLKIYALIGYKQLEANLRNEDDARLNDWEILQIEDGLKLIIQRVKYGIQSVVGDDVNGGVGSTTNGENGIEHINDIDDDNGVNVNHIDFAQGEGEGANPSFHQLFVVLYYSTELPDSIAKLKIDNVSKALSEGLEGCNGI